MIGYVFASDRSYSKCVLYVAFLWYHNMHDFYKNKIGQATDGFNIPSRRHHPKARKARGNIISNG